MLMLSVFGVAPTSEQYSNGTSYDFVIVGGGTSGLVVASRLTEIPSISVLVIEAGGSVLNNPNVTNTTQFGLSLGTSIDWGYQSEPQVYTDNKTFTYYAGKALGGTSTINGKSFSQHGMMKSLTVSGMTYIRPSAAQINLWQSFGLDWNWDTLLSYAKKSEEFQIPPPNVIANGATFDPEVHGFSGPVDVSFNPHLTPGDFHTVVNQTWQSLGIGPDLEPNDGDLLGYGAVPSTLNGHADIREDAARAYYYPVENRSNLHVMLDTTVTRILWTEDDADGSAVASGVEFVHASGEIGTASASGEVILSAGSIRSPALLENSGVGNPDVLARYSIETKVNLPAVGENLQDQPNGPTIFAVANQNISGFPSYVTHVSLQDLFGDDTDSIYQYGLSQIPSYAATIASKNSGASNASTQETLLRSQLDLLYSTNTPASEILNIGLGSLIGSTFWSLLPFGRGSLHINSTDATAQPTINPNFFEFDWDSKVEVATARMVRKWLTTPPLVNWTVPGTLTPSFETLPENATDADWLAYLKAGYGPNYHPLGTCAMLPQDMGGVVDNDHCVYGTKNVRVIDASVLPLQVCGHLTSTLYAFAERAAEKIKTSIDGT